MVKKYVFIPRSFLVIHVCNQGKTLCSPCRTASRKMQEYCLILGYVYSKTHHISYTVLPSAGQHCLY